MPRLRLALGLGILVAAGSGLFWWRSSPRPGLPPASIASGSTPAPAPVAPPEPTQAPGAELRLRPHPITPEREATAAQHAELHAIESAIEARDFPRARQLLDEHRRRPASEIEWEDQWDGFEAVLDCIEHPGPASRQRAERFVDENRASPLRRRVRRACLEP